ncbi:MAG: hypothetical protein M3Y54_04050 [Bacteroidota bacterium]|nr:hypothetical protein [Bacteroidota bacterium]
MLRTGSALGQTPAPLPAPVPVASRVLPPDAQEQISIPIPRTISLLIDVVSVLAARNNGKDKVQQVLDRRHERQETGGQSIIISVPKNRLTQRLGLTG